MTIRQYQERVAEFPAVMDGGMKTLDACVLGLISTTGRLEKLVRTDPARTPMAHEAASQVAGETLWLLTVMCNELGIQLQDAAAQHLDQLAEAARKRPD